jgi:uncharacterized membrane protein
MAVTFEHQPHPRVAEHRKTGPVRTADQHTGINGRVALLITGAVGTMWCAYLFTLLALISAPSAFSSGDAIVIVAWVAQTFIQLVLLPIIIVGQNIQAKSADKRAEDTYKDAEATFHEAEQIQAHLKAQDDALDSLLDKLAALEAARAQGA